MKPKNLSISKAASFKNFKSLPLNARNKKSSDD